MLFHILQMEDIMEDIPECLLVIVPPLSTLDRTPALGTAWLKEVLQMETAGQLAQPAVLVSIPRPLMLTTPIC